MIGPHDMKCSRHRRHRNASRPSRFLPAYHRCVTCTTTCARMTSKISPRCSPAQLGIPDVIMAAASSSTTARSPTSTTSCRTLPRLTFASTRGASAALAFRNMINDRGLIFAATAPRLPARPSGRRECSPVRSAGGSACELGESRKLAFASRPAASREFATLEKNRRSDRLAVRSLVARGAAGVIRRKPARRSLVPRQETARAAPGVRTRAHP